MFRHLLFVLALATTSAVAHEGHDHGPEAPPPPATMQPRGEAHSEDFELVAVAEKEALVFYLDDYRSNAAVEGAAIEIETPDGPKSAQAIGGGVYRLDAPFLKKPGSLDLIATINAGERNDILPLTLLIPEPVAAANEHAPAGWLDALRQPWLTGVIGFVLGGVFVWMLRRRATVAAAIAVFMLAPASNEIRAHDGHDHAAPSPASGGGERAQRDPNGSLFVPKPIQRIFGLRTVVAETGAFPRSVELPGRVIPDPNHSGFVQTAIGGVLSPPPDGFPRLGAKVNKGDVLAFVTPPMQAIDVSDMRQKQGELDQQIAIVERRLARYESLVPSGAVARTQLEDTRLELEGLRDRRLALDTLRREPVPLIAPVAGVIADGTPVTGQIAQGNAVVFHIVTPGRLWVEALSFDAIGGFGRAFAKTANGKSLPLTFRGAGLADRSQSIPVHFSIDGAETGLRAGQFVSVFAQTGAERKGIAVPRTAIVRAANGQDFVFERTSAERFEPRPVRIEPLDGERVLIAAGIDPGKRVVTQGAELLDHVR